MLSPGNHLIRPAAGVDSQVTGAGHYAFLAGGKQMNSELGILFPASRWPLVNDIHPHVLGDSFDFPSI